MAQSFTAESFEYTTSSGRVFKLQELNALQQVSADSLSGSDKFQMILTYRLAMSLVSVDGEEYLPANSDLLIEGRLQSLRGREADELVIAYAKRFNGMGDDLKNESTPAA